MKRFKWRLQRVLDVKQKTEKAKTAQLLQITEMLAEARASLMMERNKLRQAREELMAKSVAERLEQQPMFLRYTEENDRRIAHLERRIMELEQRKQETTREVIELKRAKEAMEKLKEEDRLRFLKEQDKLVQKEDDDRAGTAFIRQQGVVKAVSS